MNTFCCTYKAAKESGRLPRPGSVIEICRKCAREENKAEERWWWKRDAVDPIDSPAHYNVGGIKFDSDKPRMDLLDAEALEELTKVLTFGAKKYAVENWRKGISFRRLLAAALRHVFAFMRGEDKDPETGLSHMAHAMCCAMFVIWMQRHRPDMDDRYKHDIQTPAES